MHSDVVIDQSVAWGFFDGACQGLDRSCSVDFILHLSKLHFNLLKTAVNRNISDLQVFGDSKLVNDWMKREAEVTNLGLHFITLQLLELSALFSSIRFIHIRREFNNAADALSKDALLLSKNRFVLEEFSGGDLFSRREENISDL